MKTPRTQKPPTYRGRDERGDCFVELGSLTLAMKAQELLSTAAIPSRVEKIEASTSRRGCSYGLRLSCLQKKNALTVLERGRIPIKRWNKD